MSNCHYLKNILSLVTLLVLLKIPTTSSDVTDNEMFNSEAYSAFLNHFLSTSKRNQRIQEPENEMAKEPKYIESPYERVVRNLRTNWETPMNYLQERGYLQNVDPKMRNSLSMDANNLINGPLLNPSTSKYFSNFPTVPNSMPSTDRNDRDCNYPDLACFDQYFGENMAKSIKDKWQSWFNKNQTTTSTTTPTTTTTNPPLTSSTTPYPIANKTTEVISDLSLQDARDGLEFFKIYNDFMLTKLASKLSQDAHERRMLKSAQNEKENVEQNFQNPTQAPLIVPDFSTINENDIQLLKELDSCLKNKKSSTNGDGKVSILETEGTMNEARNDNRVSDTYVPTKLKFLAHLHHEVVDIGQYKPFSKPTVNQSGCNVGITNLGATNGI